MINGTYIVREMQAFRTDILTNTIWKTPITMENALTYLSINVAR